MIFIELDSRRRCSLAKVGWKEHTLYIAETDDQTGIITLTPAAVVPLKDLK